MATDVLTLPRKLRLPLWGMGLGVLVAFATLVSNTFTTEVTASESEWETQGTSNCEYAASETGTAVDEVAFDAFIPGMRGHGACNRGGFIPGTNVIVVTNLNSSGAGSLDYAATVEDCPKVILFGVAGVITTTDDTWTTKICDNWSIVGASAPDDITLTGANSINLRPTGNNWTVDHLTITGGAVDDAVGIIGNSGGPNDNGIMMNNTMVWGQDETLSCYPPIGQEKTNILIWQNIMARIVSGSPGHHILQDTCTFISIIRNLYTDSRARVPLLRGDATFNANNVAINSANDYARMQPCQGYYATPTDPVRYAWESNLFSNGPASGGAGDSGYIRKWSADPFDCTTVQIWETGTRAMHDNQFIEDCSNHGCTGGIPSESWVASRIDAIHPTGYVPETIGATQQDYVDFSTKIGQYAGSRPNDRFSYTQGIVDQGISSISGIGTESAWFDGKTVAQEGGLSVISASDQTGYDPTDGNQNPCGVEMPTGTAADTIQDSGLTGLHEWVITCFYDNVMPSGYRESATGLPAP